MDSGLTFRLSFKVKGKHCEKRPVRVRSSDGIAISSMGTPHGSALYVFIHTYSACVPAYVCVYIYMYAKRSHLEEEKEDLKHH